jgi:hypothetical protein
MLYSRPEIVYKAQGGNLGLNPIAPAGQKTSQTALNFAPFVPVPKVFLTTIAICSILADRASATLPEQATLCHTQKLRQLFENNIGEAHASRRSSNGFANDSDCRKLLEV